MTRPCFALTVLAAVLGISLSLAGRAQCQTLTDLNRCGTAYDEICPFVDGAPDAQDEVPLTTEEQDLRGMAVVAFLADAREQQPTEAVADEAYDYRNYYEEAYRKYYDEAYGEQDESDIAVVDPEPATMDEAMEAYRTGYDSVYDVSVYGAQPIEADDDHQASSHEPTYEADEYCSDDYYDDDAYYDDYYGGDYRYYDEMHEGELTDADDAVADDDACSGYENYGSEYYDYDDDYAYDVPAEDADEFANRERVEPETWDAAGYDYDEYYDYREDYEEQYAQEPVAAEEPATDDWDEDRHGYYDYAYEYGYDASDEANADTAEASAVAEEIVEEEGSDFLDTCQWDRDGDGFYDETPQPESYEYDEYGAEAAEQYEEAVSDNQPEDLDEFSDDDEYWDDSYYGYDYSLGEESADDLDTMTEPEAETLDNSADAEAYEYDCDEYDCDEYDDVYDDYYYDDCACPESATAAQTDDVAQLGRDVLESALQSDLATVIRGQADKLSIKVGSLISDANMQDLWQRLHEAAESEANAVALHQPNIFVFTFEVDQVSKAELARRGALVWAAQVLDRVGSACQQVSDRLERIASVESDDDTWMAQQESTTQR